MITMCPLQKSFVGAEWKLLFQGAESRVYEGNYQSKQAILKERFPKRYRLDELDKKLTKERIRAEIKAYTKLSTKSAAELSKALPSILFSDDRHIILTRIENACTLNMFIAECELEQQSDSIRQALLALAKLIAQIHSTGLIHGDLTTSNFMVIKQQQPPITIVPIDFGLSYSSNTDENRAVDLYVLERAVQSTHPNVDMNIFLNEYQTQMGTDKINKRLDQVRMRGRKRLMIG
ncbi:TP53 regulating kinase [Dermatophagoides pteronyssinus]|uniref:TP53 regulating kinase n=1 Tax=Dermatophagoides pteronyssinus TaxID=6956 RepID=UPI003F660CF2